MPHGCRVSRYLAGRDPTRGATAPRLNPGERGGGGSLRHALLPPFSFGGALTPLPPGPPPPTQAKQPWYVHARPGCVAGGTGLETGTLLWVAGLYDSTTRSFTLLTADAPPRLRWLHDRVPVLLDQVGCFYFWPGCGRERPHAVN